MRKNYKVCPRCKTKEPLNNPRCSGCGLVFERMKNVTNKAGKKAIKNKEYNKVLYVTNFPKDVNRIKFLILTIFLGLFGVHYYRVGRYKWFIFDLIAFFFAFVYSVVLVFFKVSDAVIGASYWGLLLQLSAFPFGVSAIMWVGSIIQVLTKSFKIPVAIDEEYFVEENLTNDKVAKEILKQVEDDHKAEIKLKRQESKVNKKKQKYFCPNCGYYVKLKKGENACPNCDEPLK